MVPKKKNQKSPMKLKSNIVVDQDDDLEKFITDAELAEVAK